MKKSTVDYFASINIPLMNTYGLSEVSGSATQQLYHSFSLDCVGRPLAGVDVKIVNPDEKGEGEVVIRGRHVMMGYFKNEEATKQALDEEGYLRTGDLGVLQGGFLRITGRIKELIITAGGENVAPIPIEDNFKEACPACSNIMLVGENQRFIAALITFKVGINMKNGLPSNDLLPEAA